MNTDNLEKAKTVTETLGAVRTHAEEIADGIATEHTEADEKALVDARGFVLQWLHKKQDALSEDDFDADTDVHLLVETMMCMDYFTADADERVAQELYERVTQIYMAMVMHTTALYAREQQSLEPEYDPTFM